MSKLTTAVAGTGIGVGILTLVFSGVLRVLVLHWSFGLAALTLFLFVEGIVDLTRALSPLRSSSYFKRGDVEAPGIVGRVITMELAIAAVSTLVVALSAPWWQRVLGIGVPLWLVSLMAARAAGMQAMTTLGLLERPLVVMLVLFDMFVVRTVAALLAPSVEVFVMVTTLTTFILVALAMGAPTNRRVEEHTGKKLVRTSNAILDSTDRWMLGTWVDSIARNLAPIAVVAIAGASAVVPWAATVAVAGLLVLPFFAASVVGAKWSAALRAALGVVLASMAVFVVHELGPAMYRAIYPASFGDGRWLEVLAWSGLGVVPYVFRGETTTATQLRIGVVGALACALVIGLPMVYGTPGLLAAVVAHGVLAATIAKTTFGRS